jgi:DNA-directed RNA polymerase subunit RPC12/RpoP
LPLAATETPVILKGMGEHIFRVFLNDLKTARVTCTKCGTAIELEIDSLHRIDALECPNCSTRFVPRDKRHFADLRHALQVFQHLKEVSIEFPIKLPSEAFGSQN